MRCIYFDCFAGISGDMALGALVDLGADPDELRKALSSLPVDEYEIQVGRAMRGHISATDIRVVILGHPQRHRRLGDIVKIIDGSDLSDWVKETSRRVFARLAEAEASVHGTSPDEVHFHEVGAVDAIVDIVGTAVCLELLGRPKVLSSPLPTFHGFVQSAHGAFPLPAPATAELLRGVPWRRLDVEGELVTPTGAAIITAIASEFGPMPSMTVERIGYGAGKRDSQFPNVLRVMLGEMSEETPSPERVAVIETNIDDLNPQFYDHVMDRLFAAGALDVYLAPIQMKKNRPGTLLSVIGPPERARELAEIVFAETSTLGVRVVQSERICLERRWEEVETDYGRIKIKIGLLEGRVINAAPEYEDCKRAAEDRGVSLKEVYDAAAAAYKAGESKS